MRGGRGNGLGGGGEERSDDLKVFSNIGGRCASMGRAKRVLRRIEIRSSRFALARKVVWCFCCRFVPASALALSSPALPSPTIAQE